MLGAVSTFLVLSLTAAGPLERGRDFTQLFFASDVDGLWDRLAPALQKSFHTKAGLRAFRRKLWADFGDEQRVIEELVQPSYGYVRTATYSHWGGAIELEWTFDRQERATSVSVHPSAREAPTRYDAYRTKTALRLPFEGTWNVLWGGHAVPDNRHAVSADMRFAYDFLISRGDSSFEGDGSRREQYFCWGRPLYAPGEGRVVAVVDGIPDNVPGQVNPDRLYGNHILIDHGNREVSLLAHLRNGSITVRRGQHVAAGAAIAQCGNSGNSTEPHLHYQLMTGREYLKALGLPAQFENYTADGQFVPRGEPKKGQVIEATGSTSTGSRD